MDLSPTDDGGLVKQHKKYIENIRASLMRAGSALDTANGMIQNLLFEIKRSGTDHSLLRSEEDAVAFLDDIIRLANDAANQLENLRKK